MRTRTSRRLGTFYPQSFARLVCRFSLTGLIVLAGCGGSTPPVATSVAGQPETLASTPPEQPRRAGTISRAELLPVLEGGLGRFLGGIDTDPEVVAGQFVGWRITRLFPDDARFADIALRPGDVVTRVNAQAIERPEQAFRVWDGLRVASELVVDFTHEGQPRQMRYAIED